MRALARIRLRSGCRRLLTVRRLHSSTIMPPSAASVPLARRLGALLLALSVLLSSIGWTHVACGAMSSQLSGAIATGSHPGVHSGAAHVLDADRTSGARAVEMALEGAMKDTGRTEGHCASHGCPSQSQSSSEDSGCAMAAHCTTAISPSAVAVIMPVASTPTEPDSPSPGRLLERAYQPDAPPPRA